MPDRMPNPIPAAMTAPAEQFATAEQQREAVTLGMWAFLATEILFFGGMLFSYTVYRISYSSPWQKAGHELDVAIGSINTAVLLTSSLFMALAVRAAQLGKNRRSALHLMLTGLLGISFMVLKALEYYDDFKKRLVPNSNFAYSAAADAPVLKLFYYLYFAMTGLHALHLTIGITIVAVMAKRIWQGRYSAAYHNPIEAAGLYWHFVDIVWIFLYPLLYLIA